MSATILAQLYDAHHRQDAEDLPFWVTWAQKQGGPILELGCGSGRVLLPLAQVGHRVFGLDNDVQMLSFLQSKISQEMRKRVTLIRSDIRHYCLTTRFPLIIFPCNTYSTTNLNDRRIVLNRVRLHLSTDGVFISSMPNPFVLAELSDIGESETEIETSFPHPQTGNPVQVYCQWNHSQDAVTFTWHYDHLLPDGQVERQALSVKHYLQEIDAIRQDFAQAGFKRVDAYGDYDQSEFSEDSPLLIFVASA